jgi:hypothetical protein
MVKELKDVKGRPIVDPRIDEHGNVFDRKGYDTGLKAVVSGIPIRDKGGHIVQGAYVDRNGEVRSSNGHFVQGYVTERRK